jgi:hypothetical protein
MSNLPTTAAHALLQVIAEERNGRRNLVWPGNEELEALARDYLAKVHPRPRLGQLGNVFVTSNVGEEFARQAARAGLAVAMESPDDARQKLTGLLLDAVQNEAGQWRIRRGGLDVDVTVTWRGRIAVVIHVNCRGKTRGGQT